VFVFVAVGTGVFVFVAVGTGVLVFVAVGTGVLVFVTVGTGVLVFVAVGTGVFVFIGVLVGVLLPCTSMLIEPPPPQALISAKALAAVRLKLRVSHLDVACFVLIMNGPW